MQGAKSKNIQSDSSQVYNVRFRPMSKKWNLYFCIKRVSISKKFNTIRFYVILSLWRAEQYAEGDEFSEKTYFMAIEKLG